MGSEDVEAAVVHVGQELGGSQDGRLSGRRFYVHAPSLPSAGSELIPKGGEGNLQLFVIPGNKYVRLFGHKLVVLERRHADAEPAAQLFADGDLHDFAVLSGGDPAPLPGVPAFEGFEKEGLSFPAAVEEEAGGLADANGRLFGGEDEGEPNRGLSLGDQEIQSLPTDGTEVVFGLVEETVGPRFEATDGHAGFALLIVQSISLGRLHSLLPEI